MSNDARRSAEAPLAVQVMALTPFPAPRQLILLHSAPRQASETASPPYPESA